jgi:hypothetical protein
MSSAATISVSSFSTCADVGAVIDSDNTTQSIEMMVVIIEKYEHGKKTDFALNEFERARLRHADGEYVALTNRKVMNRKHRGQKSTQTQLSDNDDTCTTTTPTTSSNRRPHGARREQRSIARRAASARRAPLDHLPTHIARSFRQRSTD